MMWRSQKSLLKKIPKSRVGKPTIGFQTFVDKLNKMSSAAFRDELEKIALTPSIEKQIEKDKVTEAIRTVREGSTPTRHLEAGTVSGALGPSIMVASRSIKALADARPGNRGKAVKDALKGITRGDVAQAGVGSGLTGVAFSLSRGTLGKVHARRALEGMGLGHYAEKNSADVGTVVMPPKPPMPPQPPKPKQSTALPKVRPPINPYKTVHQVLKR